MTYGAIHLPEPSEVIDGLGDKVTVALFGAVSAAVTVDLEAWRTTLPDHAAASSGRGMATYIHDLIWTRVREALDDDLDVTFRDSGPTREILVHGKYRIRFKQHTGTGGVRSYQTPTAIAFNIQGGHDTFPGMDEVRVCVGYDWDSEARIVLGVVMSLHHGDQARAVWVIGLEPGVEEGGVPNLVPLRPTGDEPTLPQITFGDTAAEETGDGAE